MEMGQNLIVGLCFFVWPPTEMTRVISVGGHRKTTQDLENSPRLSRHMTKPPCHVMPCQVISGLPGTAAEMAAGATADQHYCCGLLCYQLEEIVIVDGHKQERKKHQKQQPLVVEHSVSLLLSCLRDPSTRAKRHAAFEGTLVERVELPSPPFVCIQYSMYDILQQSVCIRMYQVWYTLLL